jgi:phosphoribosylpyrophosphate synthetase
MLLMLHFFLQSMGVDRVVAVDLHCGQIQVRFLAIFLRRMTSLQNILNFLLFFLKVISHLFIRA